MERVSLFLYFLQVSKEAKFGYKYINVQRLAQSVLSTSALLLAISDLSIISTTSSSKELFLKS